MFLFDTDIITNVLKKKPSTRLLKHLADVPNNEQFISTITISEIVYGAAVFCKIKIPTIANKNPQLKVGNL